MVEWFCGYLLYIGAIYVHGKDVVYAVPFRMKSYPISGWRPGDLAIFIGIVCDLIDFPIVKGDNENIISIRFSLFIVLSRKGELHVLGPPGKVLFLCCVVG